jgi:adenylate cyclase
MHNGHLRVEEVSRQSLGSGDRWQGPTAAVVNEGPGAAGDGAPGDLLPRRVVAAIMLTDMVGFSRDMERSEERTYAKLMRHNEIVRAALGRHAGREIKTIGDAFLVHFGTAGDAIRAAVEIQQALARYNEEHPDGERIVVRIGIHAGDVLSMDGDVLGNNVNLAARIEPQAEPGGICFSEDAYRQLRGALEWPASSLGRRPLKNIANPPELFLISRETLAATRPSSGTPS